MALHEVDPTRHTAVTASFRGGSTNRGLARSPGLAARGTEQRQGAVLASRRSGGGAGTDRSGWEPGDSPRLSVRADGKFGC